MSGKSDFLDALAVVSFIVGLANYSENVDQSAMSETVKAAVDDIHAHLAEQDEKIAKIYERIVNQ